MRFDVYKKMHEKSEKYQKVASAIYLITSFFASEEPLKWRLRSLAADLVARGSEAKAPFVLEVRQLLSLAAAAGLLSEANHSILRSELEKLEPEAEGALTHLLDTPLRAPQRPLLEPRTPLSYREPIKDNIPQSAETKAEDRPVLKDFGAVSVKKNSRQSIIIALLKRKKEVMIKDVTPLIAGCSEKTIQRELSDMVEAGILRRIGEKRWTRYTLA